MAIDAAGLMSLQAWSRHRRDHLRQLLAYQRARTVSLGPHLRLQFEDEQTLRYRIQEVLRIERVDDAAAVRREIETWAHLLPDGMQWTATLMIELPTAELRARWMPLLNQAIPLLYLETPRLPPVVVQANEDPLDRHLRRASGVHFLRFALSESFRRAVQDGQNVQLGCEHDRYRFRRLIPAPMLESLRDELALPRDAMPEGEHLDRRARGVSP